jgi:Ca-activated chloride channel family protein
VNLAIVLDRSGSMSGDKIERAKDAAIEALRRLGPRDRFSVVVFDHEVETIVPPQSAAQTEWIEPRIRGIRARGNTALFAGVSQGAAEIRKHLEGDYVHRIILLSDGQANVGPSAPADLARFGEALRKERISVTTVGVGMDYNEDLMTQLAQRSDGNTYYVSDHRDLPRIFAAELGDVLSVVARDVQVEILFPEGVRPVRIIGREGRLGARAVELSLNQLYGGQAKYALIEVELPPGRNAETREVALARVNYESLISRMAEQAEGRVSIRYSADERRVEESVNRDVNREVVLNIIAETKDRVVELADRQDLPGAAQALREQRTELGRRAKDLDAETQAQVEQLEEDAQKLEREGMDADDRKNFRSDSFQMRNQQRSK